MGVTVKHADGATTAAAGLAERAHAHQVDKAGQPYINHIRRVASYVHPRDDHVVAAALLHDILEDTPITATDLAQHAIPPEVITAVELLTRDEDQPSDDYYHRIRGHRLAREVKLADLADNTDPQRLALLPESHKTRLVGKYTAAYHALGTDPSDGHHRRCRTQRVQS